MPVHAFVRYLFLVGIADPIVGYVVQQNGGCAFFHVMPNWNVCQKNGGHSFGSGSTQNGGKSGQKSNSDERDTLHAIYTRKDIRPGRNGAFLH